MNTEEVKARVLSLPEVAAWPEMSNLYERSLLQPHQIIEWPYRACKAVGGDESLAVQSAAAILCMSISITLVDDMLDKDSRGMHLPLGDAVTANLSFAFQAAAFRLICDTPTDGERRASVVADFADMGIAIAYGQHLDTLNLSG
jgi:geranylgeranyl pyrophosphate synthase